MVVMWYVVPFSQTYLQLKKLREWHFNKRHLSNSGPTPTQTHTLSIFSCSLCSRARGIKIHFLNSTNFVPTIYKSEILWENKQIIDFSVTISYGRYGEFIPQPLEFDPQCDLCKNTLFVKPDAASELFPGCRVEEGWPGMKDQMGKIWCRTEKNWEFPSSYSFHEWKNLIMQIYSILSLRFKLFL